MTIGDITNSRRPWYGCKDVGMFVRLSTETLQPFCLLKWNCQRNWGCLWPKICIYTRNITPICNSLFFTLSKFFTVCKNEFSKGNLSRNLSLQVNIWCKIKTGKVFIFIHLEFYKREFILQANSPSGRTLFGLRNPPSFAWLFKPSTPYITRYPYS